jgi:hypothetical protein
MSGNERPHYTSLDTESSDFNSQLRAGSVARLSAKLFELIKRHEDLRKVSVQTDPEQDVLAY